MKAIVIGAGAVGSTVDGLSVVGPVPAVSNYYLVVTHSGVKLSPYLAKVAADEIVRGKEHPKLGDFRPSRFFK